MSTTVTIYHNPRCSKSRAALALLEERGVTPQVVEYLKTPPDAATLRHLLAMIGITARELARTGEAEFKENFKDLEMTETQWIAALVAHPVLIERPIVVAGNRAVVGRPPEKILEIL